MLATIAFFLFLYFHFIFYEILVSNKYQKKIKN